VQEILTLNEASDAEGLKVAASKNAREGLKTTTSSLSGMLAPLTAMLSKIEKGALKSEWSVLENDVATAAQSLNALSAAGPNLTATMAMITQVEGPAEDPSVDLMGIDLDIPTPTPPEDIEEN
jgi:hypothetical protein